MKCKDLFDDEGDFCGQITFSYRFNKTPSELELLMLKHGVQILTSRDNTQQRLTKGQINQMTFDELSYLVKSYTKRPN